MRGTVSCATMSPGHPSRVRFFPAAIRAGDDSGSQGRPHSMTGSGNGNITIGHVWGIPIQINPSIVPDPRLSDLDAGRRTLLPAAYPEMSDVGRWLTALLTALLFFASILFHELAHAWVARRNGIPVVSITLYIFGGIAQLGGKPKTPGAEFRVAAVGPALQPRARRHLLRDQPGGRRSRVSRRIVGVAGLHQPDPGAVQSAARLSPRRRPHPGIDRLGFHPESRRRASRSPGRPARSSPTD